MEMWDGGGPVRRERIAPDPGRRESESGEAGTWRSCLRWKSEFDETNPNSGPKPFTCQWFNDARRDVEAAKQTQSRRGGPEGCERPALRDARPGSSVDGSQTGST